VKVHRFDVVEEDGEVIALIQTVDEGDQLLIENVAVDPNHQGLGHGRRLLALAEDIARELGRPRVRLYTNQRFEVNIALYQRLGYVIEREEALSGGTVAVHMSKAVPR
jgi:ribosomal protein S18 acetylase RimI-like enzyme